MGLTISCELSSGEIERRRDALLPGLADHAVERRELTDGFRWRFEREPELLARIAAVIQMERECCRFLRFRLDVQPDDGPVWLEVTGPEGTVEFLSTLLTTRGRPESASGNPADPRHEHRGKALERPGG